MSPHKLTEALDACCERQGDFWYIKEQTKLLMDYHNGSIHTGHKPVQLRFIRNDPLSLTLSEDKEILEIYQRDEMVGLIQLDLIKRITLVVIMIVCDDEAQYVLEPPYHNWLTS